MKERILILIISCFIGLGACFFAYKHGPISFSQKQQILVQPPGWTPQIVLPKSS